MTLGFESGGNESDNSVDEPNSVASDTNLIKKSTQPKVSTLPIKPADNGLMNRAALPSRSNYQPLIREESVRSHRNNIHRYILKILFSLSVFF